MRDRSIRGGGLTADEALGPGGVVGQQTGAAPGDAVAGRQESCGEEPRIVIATI